MVSDGHRTTSLPVSTTESIYGEMSPQAHDQPTVISWHIFPAGSSLFLLFVIDSWLMPKLTRLLALYLALGRGKDLIFPSHTHTAPF